MLAKAAAASGIGKWGGVCGEVQQFRMLSDDDSDLDALIEGLSCFLLAPFYLAPITLHARVSLADTSNAVPQISVAAGQMTTTFLRPLPMEDAFHRREVGPAFPWQA